MSRMLDTSPNRREEEDVTIYDFIFQYKLDVVIPDYEDNISDEHIRNMVGLSKLHNKRRVGERVVVKKKPYNEISSQKVTSDSSYVVFTKNDLQEDNLQLVYQQQSKGYSSIHDPCV